jgi:hypothetical protein
VLAPMIEAGLVATCAVVEFEVLWSTRTISEFSTVRRDRWLGYEWLPIENADWMRSLDLQEQLWAAGSIRSVPLPDLLIAAVAERHRVSILHYDSDYDQIAALTGQPTEWIVPRGSVS